MKNNLSLIKSRGDLPPPLPQFLHTETKIVNENNPDYIYYDVLITNLQSTTTPPPALYYNENRNKPYVPISGDYDLSITRFQLDTQTLPIFIPVIQPNQGDPDLTIYSITLSYGAVDSAQTFLNWIPQDTSAPVPPPPNMTSNGQADNQFGYYNAYNFSWLTYLMNAAFQQATTSLIANVIAAGGALPVFTRPPIMTWDSQNNIATISAQTPLYDSASGGLYIRVYFNSPLFTLFSTFVATYQGYTGVVNGKNNQIILANYRGTNTAVLPPDSLLPEDLYLQVYQEQPSVSSWSPIASIVFTSATLPLVPNNISAPLIFSDTAQLGASDGNNANISQVLTDFCVGDNQYQPYVLYNPTAEYRRISLFGSQPLTNFDLNVYWKDRVGTLHPLLLASGATCTIKILFERRAARGGR